MDKQQHSAESLLASIPQDSDIKKRTPAPVHLWNTPLSGEMDILIARDGTWYHEGDPIRRQALAQLFASILRLDDDQHYYLVTPAERWAIQVEDAPFVALQLEVEGSGQTQRLRFLTNMEESVEVDDSHRLWVELNPESGEPSPYVMVRSNLKALIQRNPFYQLVELAVECELDGKTRLGVWSSGVFFPLDSA